jgi:hypothetical protein
MKRNNVPMKVTVFPTRTVKTMGPKKKSNSENLSRRLGVIKKEVDSNLKEYADTFKLDIEALIEGVPAGATFQHNGKAVRVDSTVGLRALYANAQVHTDAAKNIGIWLQNHWKNDKDAEFSKTLQVREGFLDTIEGFGGWQRQTRVKKSSTEELEDMVQGEMQEMMQDSSKDEKAAVNELVSEKKDKKPKARKKLKERSEQSGREDRADKAKKDQNKARQAKMNANRDPGNESMDEGDESLDEGVESMDEGEEIVDVEYTYSDATIFDRDAPADLIDGEVRGLARTRVEAAPVTVREPDVIELSMQENVAEKTSEQVAKEGPPPAVVVPTIDFRESVPDGGTIQTPVEVNMSDPDGGGDGEAVGEIVTPEDVVMGDVAGPPSTPTDPPASSSTDQGDVQLPSELDPVLTPRNDGIQQIKGAMETGTYDPIHKDAIGLFFGSASSPKWDPTLLTYRKDGVNKGESPWSVPDLLQQSRAIYDKHGIDLLITGVVSSESTAPELVVKENHEILQLWNRVVKVHNDGFVQMKISDLVKFETLLEPYKATPVTPVTPDQPSSDGFPTIVQDRKPIGQFQYNAQSNIRLNDIVNDREARAVYQPSLSEVTTRGSAPSLESRDNFNRGYNRSGLVATKDELDGIGRIVIGTREVLRPRYYRDPNVVNDIKLRI